MTKKTRRTGVKAWQLLFWLALGQAVESVPATDYHLVTNIILEE